jgi:hypothetical protein
MVDLAINLLPTFLIVSLGWIVYWFFEKIYYRWLIRRMRDAGPKDPAPPQ